MTWASHLPFFCDTTMLVDISDRFQVIGRSRRVIGRLMVPRYCNSTDLLVHTLMAEGLVLPYLDIPFQHASPRILKAMKRPGSQEKVLERIAQWRKICPELVIRSTFIVGFPGETEEDFEMLLDFLTEAQLDRVGCFMYSDVEGAVANELPDPVDEETKQERYGEAFLTVIRQFVQ